MNSLIIAAFIRRGKNYVVLHSFSTLESLFPDPFFKSNLSVLILIQLTPS
jgi:hypothetical protein